MDEFIKTLIAEVKSQGVFDEFRFNCCLADVDTKPAYQNVRTRVETAVNDFLAKQHWTPDTNKVQLRERLRKHLLDSEVLNKGVDQIVDQVVNPKVATIFEPKIESIVYKYLGITPPPPPPRPPGPLLPAAPPLPPFAGHMNGSRLLRVETGADGGLMPTDLEQISPDSDQATVKSDLKDESKDDDLPPGVDDERNFDEDTSPSYEPLSDDKPGSSKDLNNGLLNHSDSVNGVSQASQLSQVSSDSRLTMASSTESVAEIQRAAPASNSVELIANMPANISEEAQMPKFSENSSDASVAVGVDNCSRQLHFDIKQDAITFEGTERRSSVSGTNGGPLELSIEDAIMSEVKANIDDANNASIEPKQPPLPPLPKVEPEPVQPPAPPDVEPEPVQPPPPPPPEIMEEPVQPPEPTEVKLEPLQPSPPPEIKAEPAQPSTPPELKSESEPCQKVEPPANSPATESGIGSLSEPVVEDASLKDCKSPLKQELQEPHTEADQVKEEKTKVFALPEEAEALKVATASPSLSSQSQSKSSSRDKDKDKDKERRHHSHSDEKQRRRSRDRDRDRDRDRSRDKSHSKHSSSSSSKHSSSRSSSSQHRSSSSKHDRSSTSSSSKSHRESSSSKRTSSTSSSRHESSSSSSHKKHKSSSSSSRSDRDKDKDRDKERESHSRSHHSNSSSSSSSKRKDQDRGRDRDRHKSNSATTAPIQDDHTESKTKLNKRRSSDSNDEGKPPGSGCPPKSSRPEGAPEKAVESAAVENGNGTNGNSNGGTGSGSNGACDSVNGVVIVSDILQQSSSSFIELTAGSQSQKEEDDKKDEVAEKSLDQRAEQPAAQEDRLSGEPQKDNKVECVPNSPDEESKRFAGLEAQLVEPEGISEDPAGPSVESLPENMQKEAVKPEHMPAPPIPNSSDDEPAEEPVTHFEENADEFTDRLQLINRLIEDNQNLVNQLGEDHAREVRRRSGVKRRCSSLQEQPQVERESTPPPLVGSSTSGSPTKRLRQEEPKSSPTPSEASINSKENEALEKQEHDALNARRFSQKLCQQQRYTNDDLYKPRPILSQRSRRRGLDSIL